MKHPCTPNVWQTVCLVNTLCSHSKTGAPTRALNLELNLKSIIKRGTCAQMNFLLNDENWKTETWCRKMKLLNGYYFKNSIFAECCGTRKKSRKSVSECNKCLTSMMDGAVGGNPRSVWEKLLTKVYWTIFEGVKLRARSMIDHNEFGQAMVWRDFLSSF